MLKGGDRTVGIGESGLEMCQNLHRRSARCGERSGGGQQAESAVRILLWPRSNRFQMRCQVRSLRRQSATTRIAAAMLPATAR